MPAVQPALDTHFEADTKTRDRHLDSFIAREREGERDRDRERQRQRQRQTDRQTERHGRQTATEKRR